MERDVVPRGASLVVVDDVLSTWDTLGAVLQPLDEAGIGAEDVSIMVVADFLDHRSRERAPAWVWQINIQSLLVFDDA